MKLCFSQFRFDHLTVILPLHWYNSVEILCPILYSYTKISMFHADLQCERLKHSLFSLCSYFCNLFEKFLLQKNVIYKNVGACKNKITENIKQKQPHLHVFHENMFKNFSTELHFRDEHQG